MKLHVSYGMFGDIVYAIGSECEIVMNSFVLDKSQGQLLYHCATKLKDARSVDYVLPYVVNKLILNELQVNAALQFFAQFPVGDIE